MVTGVFPPRARAFIVIAHWVHSAFPLLRFLCLFFASNFANSALARSACQFVRKITYDLDRYADYHWTTGDTGLVSMLLLSNIWLSNHCNRLEEKWMIMAVLLFFFFFFAHFYFPASGQAVVTGVVPSPPRFLPLIFIAHGVQQSHCSSIFHRVLLTHALALSASQFVHKKKSQRIHTSMHSAGLELTKLTYTRLENNLIRHRGDRPGTPQRHDAAATAAAMLRTSMAGPRPNTRRLLYTYTHRQLLHVVLNTTSQRVMNRCVCYVYLRTHAFKRG